MNAPRFDGQRWTLDGDDTGWMLNCRVEFFDAAELGCVKIDDGTITVYVHDAMVVGTPRTITIESGGVLVHQRHPRHLNSY